MGQYHLEYHRPPAVSPPLAPVNCGADLVATRRLKNLDHAERRELQGRIHAMHASNRVAWVDTATGTVRGLELPRFRRR